MTVSATAPITDDARPAASLWFEKAMASPLDRVPGLAEALAHAAEVWAERFATLSPMTCEMRLEGLSTIGIDTLATRRGTAIFAAVKAPQWNGSVGLQFDKLFVSTIVEGLFGGEGGEDETVADAALSPVELRIADVIGEQIADALGTGFAGWLPAAFAFDRVLTKPDLSFLGKPGGIVMVATLALAALGRVVHCDVLIPMAMLDSIAAKLDDEPAEAEAAVDPRWSRRLEAEIGRTLVRLSAAIDVPAMSLGAVAGLSPGQLLALPSGAGQRVKLGCADEDLFRCDLGQSDGFYTLRIQEALTSPSVDDWHSNTTAADQ